MSSEPERWRVPDTVEMYSTVYIGEGLPRVNHVLYLEVTKERMPAFIYDTINDIGYIQWREQDEKEYQSRRT